MPKCSFCSKSNKRGDVLVLISSPSHYQKKAYICNNCVAVCVSTIKEKINDLQHSKTSKRRRR
jgi:ATP-dependent protease Clp ATPase subunit